MSFDMLKPEIWDHILYFLTPSLPKPLSGWTQSTSFGEVDRVWQKSTLDPNKSLEVVKRGDIRAKELAVLARTSIVFHQHATRALYWRVISDDLCSLLDHTGKSPSHPMIQSKSNQLKQIRLLHLEYRSHGSEPSYASIMRDQAYFFAAGLNSGADDESCATVHALLELKNLGALLMPFREAIQTPHHFPRLRHLSIGRIFGGSDGIWGKMAGMIDGEKTDHWENAQHLLAQTREGMVGLFRSSPLEHWCQRGRCGPLALPPIVVWFDEHRLRHAPTKPIFTIHFSTTFEALHQLETSAALQPIPAVVGHRTRWMIDNPYSLFPASSIVGHTISAIKLAQRFREYWGEFIETLVKFIPDPSFQLEIWASGNFLESSDGFKLSDAGDSYSAALRVRLDATAEEEREALRKWADPAILDLEKPVKVEKRKCRDKITWEAAVDNPGCEACGLKGRGDME